MAEASALREDRRIAGGSTPAGVWVPFFAATPAGGGRAQTERPRPRRASRPCGSAARHPVSKRTGWSLSAGSFRNARSVRWAAAGRPVSIQESPLTENDGRLGQGEVGQSSHLCAGDRLGRVLPSAQSAKHGQHVQGQHAQAAQGVDGVGYPDPGSPASVLLPDHVGRPVAFVLAAPMHSDQGQPAPGVEPPPQQIGDEVPVTPAQRQSHLAAGALDRPLDADELASVGPLEVARKAGAKEPMSHATALLPLHLRVLGVIRTEILQQSQRLTMDLAGGRFDRQDVPQVVSGNPRPAA